MKSFIRQKQNPSQLVDIRGSQNASPHNVHVLSPKICYFTRQRGIKVAHQLGFPGGSHAKVAHQLTLRWDYLGELSIVVVVQSLSCIQLFATPWTRAHQASLSLIISCSLLKFMFESVMQSNHLVLCHSLLFLPSVFPSIRVFSNESGFFFCPFLSPVIALYMY